MPHKQILKQLDIDFMSRRRMAAISSILVLLICLVSMLLRGFNLGLDFTGGTIIELGYETPVEVTDISATLVDTGFDGAVVQYFGSRQDILIRLAPQSGEASSAELSDNVFRTLVNAAANADLGDVELRRVEFVGPQVGEELREQGGLAVLFALIGILIYVAVRFEWRFAVGAVAALIHDVVFTVGMFSVFAIEFDLTVLAAVLAVIGYSLNDTIVRPYRAPSSHPVRP
ncbi:MAG: hypothetical protein N838_20690 [Thiohalocapsa sp. PB-PSB1]|nr:MAG: hypothetical protein N838_20690 [Thiohalocapsa sp. PB-PSB1]